MEYSKYADEVPEAVITSYETVRESEPAPVAAENAAPAIPAAAAPPATDYASDEFAQTRPPDDLFGDDFTPIAEPIIEQQQSPAKPPPSTHAPAGQNQAQTPRGPRKSSTNAQRPPRPTPAAADGDSASQPAAATPRSEAVRGDRSGTGGVKKAKLTEEELTTRMEAIKLKNANLEAAHARAEADEASFQASEAKAKERRRQERQNRQQMMGERERNAQRKLKALAGREWDAEKEEETPSATRGGGSNYRRGAHGGIVMDRPAAATAPANGEDIGEDAGGMSPGGRASGRGRGRGRGGGSRGRGGNANTNGSSQQARATTGEKQVQTVPDAADFPAPETKPKAGEESTRTSKEEGGPQTDTSAKGRSWAEEMDGA